MATLVDYYNSGDNDYRQFYGAVWNGQTFTASSTYTISSVKILVYRVFTPETITVSIRATDGDGKPTGNDLCSGTFDGDTLTTDSAGEWKEIIFGVPYDLISGTKYAIIVRADGAYLRWRVDDSSPTYTGGSRTGSSNSGSSWVLYTADDFMFETWGDVYVFSPPVAGDGDGIINYKKRLVAAANSTIWYEDI